VSRSARRSQHVQPAPGGAPAGAVRPAPAGPAAPAPEAGAAPSPAEAAPSALRTGWRVALLLWLAAFVALFLVEVGAFVVKSVSHLF
jgi:hypothetical protein